MYNLYEYKGAVMEFDKCVDRNWTATTWAASENKARSNLAYRYKQETNRAKGCSITLPGKLTKLQ